MEITALIPTAYRPVGLRRVLESLHKTAPSVRVVVAAERDDTEAEKIASEYEALFVVCEKYRQGCAYAWNTALQAAPNSDIYVIGSDDAEFLDGWLEASLAGLEQIGGDGLVGFDSGKRKPFAEHYMMTRKFIIEYHGGVAAVPHYSSWCVDSEAWERAKSADKYIKVESAMVLHHWDGPNGDLAYTIALERREENRKIYNQRHKAGFPDDFEPILKAVTA